MAQLSKIRSFNDAVHYVEKSPVGLKSKAAVKHVAKEVRKNPWHFMGIAAAIAAAFGFLLGRKTRGIRVVK